MTPKLYKASEVCDLAQLQPYVLRSWEKEFPGIGVQRSPDSPRLYRQSDVDQLLAIKQLIIGEGLTVAGARRRLEDAAPATPANARAEMAEVLDVLGKDVKTKIATVRQGLKEIHLLLSQGPGAFELAPPPPAARPKKAAPAPRMAARKVVAAKSAPKKAARRAVARRS